MARDHRHLLLWGLLLVSGSAWAAPARVAAPPLQFDQVGLEQRERLQAQYRVLLARVPGIQLAGSAAVDHAMALPQSEDCPNDSCLQVLADATNSRYAVSIDLRRDAIGFTWAAVAHVVRNDGALVRVVELSVQAQESTLPEMGRVLLRQVVEALALGTLGDGSPGETTAVRTTSSAQVAPAPGFVPLEFPRPPALVAREPTAHHPSKTVAVGATLLTVGLATAVAGGAVGVASLVGGHTLTHDASGSVPVEQAQAARRVVDEGHVAMVLVPAGLVSATVGIILLALPRRPPVSIAVVPGTAGAAVLVEGRLP